MTRQKLSILSVQVVVEEIIIVRSDIMINSAFTHYRLTPDQLENEVRNRISNEVLLDCFEYLEIPPQETVDGFGELMIAIILREMKTRHLVQMSRSQFSFEASYELDEHDKLKEMNIIIDTSSIKSPRAKNQVERIMKEVFGKCEKR